MIDNILMMIKNDAYIGKKEGWGISGHGNISNQVKLSRAFVRDDSGNDSTSLSTITIGRKS